LWEREIVKAFADRTPSAITQLDVKDDVFSGKIDLLIDVGGRPLIIEIKDTAAYNFKARDRLPYDSHCVQVLAYAKLLKKKWSLDSDPSTTLYYHGRAEHAELALAQYPEGVLWNGEIGRKQKDGVVYQDIDTVMQEARDRYVAYQEHNVLPEIPFSSPFEERFMCCKKVKDNWYPACNWMGYCWPQLPEHGPYDEEDYKEAFFDGELSW
jgi:hypothetical protein